MVNDDHECVEIKTFQDVFKISGDVVGLFSQSSAGSCRWENQNFNTYHQILLFTDGKYFLKGDEQKVLTLIP